MANGCGKPTAKSKCWSGDEILCGTKLTFGTGKEPRRTVLHLCDKCEETNEHTGNDSQHQGIGVTVSGTATLSSQISAR